VNVLVVPSNRPTSLSAFLDAWQPWPWDRILVVEDGPDISGPRTDGRIMRYCWRDIDASGANPDTFSRRDSGVRAFGYWKAWAMGADVTFTLDDDCFPVDGNHVSGHVQNLDATPAWQTSVSHLHVRGLPYSNVGVLRNVQVSVGLWSGHPDVDAVQTLAARGPFDAVVARGLHSRLMPSDQYFPLCGMNLAFRRDVACLMHCPPMGQHSPYGRFDDIWSGLVIQRICRHLRYGIVCGHPIVDHRRASDPFTNLVTEAPGIAANEWMWTIVDAVDLEGEDPLTCMREMGDALRRRPGRGGEYVARWGDAILDWCDLFEPAEATLTA
jgi:hypothetical protein